MKLSSYTLSLRSVFKPVVFGFLICSFFQSAQSAQVVLHNTPGYVHSAANMGPVDPAEPLEVSIWLKPHNRAQMDALARELYTPGSQNYRRWLTRSQMAERFAPTDAEVDAVREFLASNRLGIVRTGPHNFYVRARGTVADVQSAFGVQLNLYNLHGKVVRANTNDPSVDQTAAPFVLAVTGLDSGEYRHPVSRRDAVPAAFRATAAPDAAESPEFFSPVCFDGVVTERWTTNNDGELPIGTYAGNHLNLLSLQGPGCGYTPSEIQAAYKLSGLYAEGYRGKGQTIVIIDWCGSSTVEADTNVFSKRFGLPLLNSSNFKVIYTPTASSCISSGQTEINLDIQWAHAIAPDANIDLVVPPSATFQDVDEAEFYAVNYGLGNSLSGSYGSPENETPTSVLETENLISEIAALSGIATNFATGDYGDYTVYGLPQTVNAPAQSPWATAVGGVTLALNGDDSIAWQTGWGINEAVLTQDGKIFDPPAANGFASGSGGGVSNCVTRDNNGNCVAGFAKPAFQKFLSGKYRQVPDISWLGDPFTGAVIAISHPGQSPELTWEVVGGTSLACPMFSALWAIANEEAGMPLGQAAQYLYSMPKGTIRDVVPVTSKYNLKASIRESNGTIEYAPAQILSNGDTLLKAPFVSALWDWPYGYSSTLAVSFGTDCSVLPLSSGNGTPCSSSLALHTAPGWDNVTGLGTPNGQAFANFFK